MSNANDTLLVRKVLGFAFATLLVTTTNLAHQKPASKDKEQKSAAVPQNKKPNVQNTQQRICKGSPIPAGWISVNYEANNAMPTDPTYCKVPPGHVIVYPVNVIEKYDDKAVGTKMEVCSGSTIHVGWAHVGEGNTPTTCPKEPMGPTTIPTTFYIKRLK